MRNASPKLRFAWILAIPVFLAACEGIGGKRVHGNGNIKTEDRPVSNFKHVEVGGAAKVLVSQGDHASVKIETDENLLPYMEVSQDGDKIFIHEKHGFNLKPTHEIRIYVTAPIFSSIEASGACDIIGETKITNP